jgi:hypothetical protein
VVVFHSETVFAAIVEWSEVEKTIDLDQEDETAVFCFTFINRDRSPVFISKIISTCSCTAFDSNDGKPISYQARGEALIAMDCSSIFGRIKKKVEVHIQRQGANDVVGEKSVLTIIADVKRLYKAVDEELVWNFNELPNMKDTEIVFFDVKKIKSVTLDIPSDECFSSRLISTSDEKRYRLEITPNAELIRKSNVDPSVDFGRISRIKVDFTSGKSRLFNYWALIRSQSNQGRR